MSRWLVLFALCGVMGCGSDSGSFVGTLSRNACEASFPVCNTAAGCVLDESQYTDGQLPGQRQIIFRTDGPARVRVRLLFTQERSPGTGTQIEWNETGCGSQQSYSTNGQDIFQLAGDTQQIAVDRPLTTLGDHLIRLVSDATASYQLRVDVVR